MKKHRHIVAGIAGVLLIGTCLTPAFAAGISVGGVSVGIGGNSSGGTTASASVGGVGASVSVGGSGSSVATGNVTTASPATDTTATISNTDGPLATLDSDGHTTDAVVNLGALLSALEGIGVSPTDPVNSAADAAVIIGGGNGNVATATLGTADPTTDTTVSIGFTNGPLAAVDTDGQTTDAAVNLGGLLSALDGIDVPTIPGGGNPPGNDDGNGNGGGNGGGGAGNGNGGGLASAYGSLAAGEQQAAKIKCRNVLAQPRSFATNVVRLCRMIASL